MRRYSYPPEGGATGEVGGSAIFAGDGLGGAIPSAA
jgi:hypothetical protein